MLWVMPGRGEQWALSCTMAAHFMKGSITRLPRMKSSIRIPRTGLGISGQNLFMEEAGPLKSSNCECYHFRVQSMSFCQTSYILHLNSS